MAALSVPLITLYSAIRVRDGRGASSRLVRVRRYDRVRPLTCYGRSRATTPCYDAVTPLRNSPVTVTCCAKILTVIRDFLLVAKQVTAARQGG